MEYQDYAVINDEGRLVVETATLSAAAANAAELAYEDGGEHIVTMELGFTEEDDDDNAHMTGEQTGPRFVQRNAAVPVSVMRRALALAEAHDPDLAAELRASLVTP